MVLRHALRQLLKRRTLAATLLILALGAGAALAVTLSGDGTLVGSNSEDSDKTGRSLTTAG